MIIDIHVHHALGPEPRDPRPAADKLLALADQAKIDRLCLLGNVFRYRLFHSASQIRKINNTTISLVKHRPDRLSGFCFLNPQNEKAFLVEEIDRCMTAGLSGIKLEIDVNARDSRLDPIMKRAAKLDVPVMHHAWYKIDGQSPNASDPSDIAHLARRFPAATIIMAHLVGVGIRGVLDIQDCPNVMVDTSGGQPFSDMVEYGVEKLGPQRVLYGSDVCGRDFSCQLGKIYGARLRLRDRRQILGLNAARLLKLT